MDEIDRGAERRAASRAAPGRAPLARSFSRTAQRRIDGAASSALGNILREESEYKERALKSTALSALKAAEILERRR